MAFCKYPTIGNYANPRERAAVPPTERWVVLEKVDGANLQLLFTPGGERRIGRRNGWLADDEAFFGVRDILARHAAELAVLQQWADEHSTGLRVYCELYAPKILGRIPYGEGIVILDVMVHKTGGGGELLSPDAAAAFLRDLGVGHLAVPCLVCLDGWDAVVEWLRDAFRDGPRSALAPGGPVAEGVVVRPAARNYEIREGHAMLKHKTAAFAEVVRAPKECPLMDEFQGYITPSRVAGIVSKLGPPPDKAAIGRVYLPALKADALADYVRDHPGLSDAAMMQLRRTKVAAYTAFLEHIPINEN
jgi:hypothetical protein